VTPFYQDEAVVIYHGDCREVLPSIRVDAVITDPPYGTLVTPWDHPIDAETIAACINAAPDGFAAFFYSNTRLAQFLMDCKAAGADTWVAVWHKANAMGFERRFSPQWTPIVVAYRSPRRFWGQDYCMCPIRPQPELNHPTPKPIGVTSWLVERATNPGQIVLDPFMGSGTTLVAAKRLGRKAIGIERELAYCEVAVERLRQSALPLEITA
jgi:hypothetical protein